MEMLERLRAAVLPGGKGPVRTPIDVSVHSIREYVQGNERLAGKWASADAHSACQALRARAAAASQELHGAAREAWDAAVVKPQGYLASRAVAAEVEKQLGEAARDWLGRPRGALAPWAQLLVEYEKDGLFLTEGAAMLEHAMRWEAPKIRARMVQCDKEILALDKATRRSEVAIKGAVEEFRRSCERRGIAGIDLRSELLRLCAQRLPERLEALAAEARDTAVRDAVALYKAFAHYVASPASEEDEILPLLTRLGEQQHARVVVSLPPGLEPEPQVTELQWDGTLAAVVDPAKQQDSEEEGQSAADRSCDLSRGEVRSALENELAELTAFLQQRLLEMQQQQEDQISLWFQYPDAPAVVSQHTERSVRDLRNKTRSLCAAFHDASLVELLAIQEGGATLDRLVRSLEHQRRQADRLRAAVRRQQAKSTALARERLSLAPRLKSTLAAAAALKLALQAAISDRLDARKVTILGVQ